MGGGAEQLQNSIVRSCGAHRRLPERPQRVACASGLRTVPGTAGLRRKECSGGSCAIGVQPRIVPFAAKTSVCGLTPPQLHSCRSCAAVTGPRRW